MEGFLVLVAIYVVLTLLGSAQKKQRQERERALRTRGAGGAGPEQLTGLQQALLELKRAEEEARRRQQQRRPVLDLEEEGEAEGYAEESEEEIHEVEAIDLEEQGAREVEARYRASVEEAAAVVARIEAPEPPRLVARIAPSIAPAPATTPVEPPNGTAALVPRRSPLARWGRGSVRDAVVLSEILQRPVGERM